MGDSPAAQALGSGREALAALLAWTPWVAAAAGGSALAGPVGRVGGVTVSVAAVVGAGALGLWAGLRLRRRRERATRPFAVAGLAVLLPVAAVTAARARPAVLGWLAAGLAAAALLGVWGRDAIDRHGGSAPASRIGGFVVFGHAFDALTTAIGVEVFGFAERTGLSRTLLEVTAAAPGSDLLGVSWLFIAVKLVVAVGVVVLFVDYGHSPAVDVPVVAVAGFVGLWPAVHNAVLFATA